MTFIDYCYSGLFEDFCMKGLANGFRTRALASSIVFRCLPGLSDGMLDHLSTYSQPPHWQFCHLQLQFPTVDDINPALPTMSNMP